MDDDGGRHNNEGLVRKGRVELRNALRLALRARSGHSTDAFRACHERAPKGRVEWWRRRESNPRPKGLSPQKSTCVAVLANSRAPTKNGECGAR